MSVGFRMAAVPEGREVRLRLDGELRGEDERAAARLFDDALYLHPGRGIVLDVGGVTSLDGDGVLLVIGLVRLARRERRSFRIVGASDEVEAGLRLIGNVSAYGAYPLGRAT